MRSRSWICWIFLGILFCALATGGCGGGGGSDSGNNSSGNNGSGATSGLNGTWSIDSGTAVVSNDKKASYFVSIQSPPDFDR